MENFDVLKLDGHSLSVFLSVCETGSISKTAVAYDLNQSTISHTIDKVRAAVGDPLFVKAGRGIVPTEAALSLVPRVERLVAEIQGLAIPESYDPRKDNQPFALGIQTPAQLHDVKLLQVKLAKIAPNVRLEMKRAVPQNHIAQMLQEKEIDISFVIMGHARSPFLNRTPYGQDELVVFYDPKVRGPIESVEDYAEATHGVVNFGGNSKTQIDIAFEKLGRERKIALVAPTTSMLGNLLAGTPAIATMPSRWASTVSRDLTFCKAPIDLPPIYYDIAWHRRNEHSGRIIWLRNLLDEVGRELYGEAAHAQKNP